MTESTEHEQQTDNDLEAPDPAGNPAEHTSPRENQEIDPERLKRDEEDAERTIAT